MLTKTPVKIISNESSDHTTDIQTSQNNLRTISIHALSIAFESRTNESQITVEPSNLISSTHTSAELVLFRNEKKQNEDHFESSSCAFSI